MVKVFSNLVSNFSWGVWKLLCKKHCTTLSTFYNFKFHFAVFMKQKLKKLQNLCSYTNSQNNSFPCKENITFMLLIKFQLTLRKKSPYSELSWSTFFPHFPAFGLNKKDTPYLSVFSPNAGKCGNNADQNNSEYRHFLRSVK